MTLIQGEGHPVLKSDVTTKDDELVVVFENNEYEPYLVKCGNHEYIEQYINSRSHNRFIVSADFYESIDDDAMKQDFVYKGIHILNGGFRDDDYDKIVRKIAKNIGHVNEIVDGIPGFGPAE